MDAGSLNLATDSTTRRFAWRVGLALGLVLPGSALAHSFGRVYNLPVPVWMYLYGAAAALALSFVLIAWFATQAPGRQGEAERELSQSGPIRLARRLRLLPILRWLTFAGFALCIATACLGTINPYGNFSMTWFWVLFVLGFAYFTALAGNLYPALNPWKTLSRLLGRLWSGFERGRVSYPAALGDWPALGLYMAFIWIELQAEPGVRGLGHLLLGYTALNVVGVGLIGRRDWFRHCEFFGLFLRLIGLMAPLAWGPNQRLRLRAPCAGLIGARAESLGMLLFILFMLSSTAFDGLRLTTPWVKLFWVDFHALIKPWVGANPIVAYQQMKPLYELWSGFVLLASPFLYLAIYLLCIALMKRITACEEGLRELALRFAPSLLPIALVYHLTHYYTLFLSQAPKIVGLASDPFGWRWNLFGTADWLRSSWVPEPEIIWHSQLALIVGGHIVSVYIAHLVAFEIFGNRRRAALSQLPMLALMMFFTAAGLWILAQPIAGT